MSNGRRSGRQPVRRPQNDGNNSAFGDQPSGQYLSDQEAMEQMRQTTAAQRAQDARNPPQQGQMPIGGTTRPGALPQSQLQTHPPQQGGMNDNPIGQAHSLQQYPNQARVRAQIQGQTAPTSYQIRRPAYNPNPLYVPLGMQETVWPYPNEFDSNRHLIPPNPPTLVLRPRLVDRPPPPAPRLIKTPSQTKRPNKNPDAYANLVRLRPPPNMQPPADAVPSDDDSGTNGPMHIGMREICTFLPQAFQLPAVAMRSVRNEWGRKDIAKAQLYATKELTKNNLTMAENRIQKQRMEGGRTYTNPWNVREFRRQFKFDDDLTAKGWELRKDPSRTRDQNIVFGHIRLADIYGHVPRENWPTDDDRLTLTQCLEFAADNSDLDLDTSHFGDIIRDQDIKQPQNLTHQHDVEALKRLRRDVKGPEDPGTDGGDDNNGDDDGGDVDIESGSEADAPFEFEEDEDGPTNN